MQLENPRQCVIDGTRVRTLDDVYTQVAEQLSFPAHFGRNLDALFDTLTGDVQGPFEIIWKGSAQSKTALSADFDKISAVLRDAASARADFRITFS